MYVNVAYSEEEYLNPGDLSVPLRINCCGYYRVHTTPVIKTLRPEGRSDYQLLYIAQGKGYFMLNGVETVVVKGDMVLFRPGEPQVYYYYAEDKTEVYWVHFTGSQVEGYLEHYEFAKGENMFFAGVSPDYPWIFEQIIRELQLRRVNYEEMLGILLRHVFITINRYIKESRQLKNELLDDVEKAVHYFEENYTGEISIRQYAFKNHMSVNRFIDSFKNIMKVTPMQYIMSLRMTAAKGYFDSTNKNVTEVANAIGYDNPLYFSRVFKKYTGYSPSEYKKMKRA